MEAVGEFRLPAPREAVWRALHDPEMLRACIPGCERLEKRSHTQYAAQVALALGPVQARFDGIAAVSELDPPNAYRVDCEAGSGSDALVKGGAWIRLREDGAGATTLSYRADAELSGRLAEIEATMATEIARRLADQFLACLAQRLATLGAPPPPEPVVPADAVRAEIGGQVLIEPMASAPASGTTMEPVLSPGRRIPPVLWIAGLVVLLLLLLLVASR